VTISPDHQQSRAIKEFYAARLARMEYEGRDEKLVNIDEITIRHFTRAQNLRECINAISVNLAAQLAAETDTRSVEEILDAAICEALEELSGVRRTDGQAP
jgi:hypothetical protein